MEHSITLSSPIYSLNKTVDEILFPILEPFDEGTLKVSELHTLWYAQYGNPNGVPALVLHGGPGFGCSSIDMRYFDPNFYRIILLDQRGAKRSKPLAEIRENTSQDLVNDIEKLRMLLKIEQWVIFGGSWGSSLAILYGETHPQRCLGFVLRGAFLATRAEFEQIWYGMQDIFPEAFDACQNYLPPAERADLIGAFHKRYIDPKPEVNMEAVRVAMKYNMGSAFLYQNEDRLNTLLNNEAMILGAARISSFYGQNNYFLEQDQLYNNLDKINHLPAILVQGRYDIICRAKTAYKIHKKWPNSELVFVQDAGHSSADPGIMQALVNATEKMKSIVSSSEKHANSGTA